MFIVTGVLAVMVPDIPKDVKRQIQRENMLAREILLETAERGQHEDHDEPQFSDDALRMQQEEFRREAREEEGGGGYDNSANDQVRVRLHYVTKPCDISRMTV